MKRDAAGLTLLELLLAVALLGAIVTGTSWYLFTASRRSVEVAALVGERSGLRALFAAIDRDLVVGDADMSAVDGASGRVKVTAEGLRIATRSAVSSAGAVLRDYTFERQTAAVRSVERALDEGASARGGAPDQAETVLGGVVEFKPTIDPTGRTLALEVRFASGRSAARQWRLP